MTRMVCEIVKELPGKESEICKYTEKGIHFNLKSEIPFQNPIDSQ